MSKLCKRLHYIFNGLPRYRFPFKEQEIPHNGIYILFEDGERAHGADRIVRVGTHTGVNQLRSRLKQHFVKKNKDRSIFRKNIGRALLQKNEDPFLEQWEWDLTTRKSKERFLHLLDVDKQSETERAVSEYIQEHFSFVVFRADDKEQRLEIEQKIISTISWCEECRPSPEWLGIYSPKQKIRESGLWLVNGLYKDELSLGELENLQEMVGKRLQETIGRLPKEIGFKKRMRYHQAWWRSFVLAEEQGYHPIRKNELIGSAIQQGETSGKNFLSKNIRKAVDETIQERKIFGTGIIEEGRLFNNLLSSQPLCFNFFGEMKIDTIFALQVLRRFYPELTRVNRVIFEFAPDENYTNDNSAFDVAFEVMRQNKLGLIGFECKFTDTFSQKEYDKDEYREIYHQSNNFVKKYETFISARYNQLFRNQLIAAALLQNQKYDFVFTGLFCHQDDRQAIEVGEEFHEMLNSDTLFKVITYQKYIEEILQLPLEWEKRELVMMMWARYCATQLSDDKY